MSILQSKGSMKVFSENYKLKSTISPVKFMSIIPKSLYTSEDDMNDYEQKVVRALSALSNIKWCAGISSVLGFR